jgi:hypothetical protein
VEARVNSAASPTGHSIAVVAQGREMSAPRLAFHPVPPYFSFKADCSKSPKSCPPSSQVPQSQTQSILEGLRAPRIGDLSSNVLSTRSGSQCDLSLSSFHPKGFHENAKHPTQLGSYSFLSLSSSTKEAGLQCVGSGTSQLPGTTNLVPRAYATCAFPARGGSRART